MTRGGGGDDDSVSKGRPGVLHAVRTNLRISWNMLRVLHHVFRLALVGQRAGWFLLLLVVCALVCREIFTLLMAGIPAGLFEQCIYVVKGQQSDVRGYLVKFGLAAVVHAMVLWLALGACSIL